MQSDYALQYETLWKSHWWWQSRQRFVLDRIARLQRRRPLRQILDIGCGNGLFFDALRHFGEVRGIEADAGLVTDGPQRGRIEVRPFDDTYRPAQPLDLVLMLDVLEHLQDDSAAVRHVYDILAPGGFFLLTVPALMWLWSRHDDANLHYRRYHKETLAKVLTQAGFRIEMARYFFGWTLGPMLLRRVLAPGHNQEQAAYRVRVPARPINRALYALSRCEQVTVGRWGLPLGASLIAVAVKAG